MAPGATAVALLLARSAGRGGKDGGCRLGETHVSSSPRPSLHPPGARLSPQGVWLQPRSPAAVTGIDPSTSRTTNAWGSVRTHERIGSHRNRNASENGNQQGARGLEVSQGHTWRRRGGGPRRFVARGRDGCIDHKLGHGHADRQNRLRERALTQLEYSRIFQPRRGRGERRVPAWAAHGQSESSSEGAGVGVQPSREPSREGVHEGRAHPPAMQRD